MTIQSLESVIQEILDNHAEYYIRETVKFFQENGESPALSKFNKGDTQAITALLKTVDRYVEERELLAREDELLKMNMRSMDDPTDDANLFWYRTYTMPEFEARLEALRQQVKGAE